MDQSIEQSAAELPTIDLANPTETSTPPVAAVVAVVNPTLVHMADPRYAAYVPALDVSTSHTVTNPKSPFYIHGTNSPNHKFKYPETGPTPDNEDDVQWGKIYTAADSRKYNHGNKSASESRKFRVSGETRDLALVMLVENKQKYSIAVINAIARGDPIPTEIPRATPKLFSQDDPLPAPRSTPQPRAQKMDQPSSESAGSAGVSISERALLRRQTASTSTSGRNSHATVEEEIDMNHPAFNNFHHPDNDNHYSVPVQRGHEAPGPRARTMTTWGAITMPSSSRRSAGLIKKGAKRAKSGPFSHSEFIYHQTPVLSTDRARKPNNTKSTTNHWAEQDHGRNDEGEKLYCKCRSPDDRSHMIQCSNKVCSEWFHINCVPGLSVYLAEHVVEYFFCQHCTTKDSYTTYKRLCRNHNLPVKCMNLARVVPMGSDDPGSKYCSDQCALDFFNWVLANMPKVAITPGGLLSAEQFCSMVLSCETVKELQDLGKFHWPEGEVAIEIPASGPRAVPKGAIAYPDEPLPGLTEVENGLLRTIMDQKDQALDQVALTDKQLAFYRLVCARAETAATHLGVKLSAICGYDNRLSMNDWQFRVYQTTGEYKIAVKNGVLGPATANSLSILGAENVVADDGLPKALQNICLEPVQMNPKLKPGCKHNTCGVMWRDRTEDEFEKKKLRAMTWYNGLQYSLKKIKQTARERQFMKPVDERENSTESFD